MPRNPQSKKQGKKQQLFVFTLNNPEDCADDMLAALVLDLRLLTYIGFEHEIGKNGTPHIQGFFRTRLQVSLQRGSQLYITWDPLPPCLPFLIFFLIFFRNVI